nr:redoxin family protein [Panacagrimonas perspica]
MPVVILLLALSCSLGVAYTLERLRPGGGWRRQASQLVDLLLAGLLTARLAFVLRWWPEYMAEPLSILMIHDGGFLALPGVAGSVAFGLWLTRHDPGIRRPLGAAMFAGLFAWAALSNGLRLFQQHSVSIPGIALLTLDGRPTRLSDFQGRPLVVNLWASWCPPCRREMPVLEAAQDEYADTQFVFVNQREPASAVIAYLQRAGVRIEQVLLDTEGTVAASFQTPGLPATLFFDAEGRLRETHLGPITTASFAAKLAAIRGNEAAIAR